MKFLFRFLLIVFCIFYSSKIKADFLTLDSHIDIPFDYMTNPEHDPGNKTDMQVDFQKMLEGNLDGGFFIVYVGQSELDKNGFQDAKKKAIIKFNAIKKMVEKYPERIVLVKNPSEVYQAKREIDSSIKYLNQFTKLKTFCYPYGSKISYNSKIKNYLSKKVSFSVTVTNKKISNQDFEKNRQEFSRLDCNNFKYGRI